MQQSQKNATGSDSCLQCSLHPLEWTFLIVADFCFFFNHLLSDRRLWGENMSRPFTEGLNSDLSVCAWRCMKMDLDHVMIYTAWH